VTKCCVDICDEEATWMVAFPPLTEIPPDYVPTEKHGLAHFCDYHKELGELTTKNWGTAKWSRRIEK
jgi:hypothetical protein